MIEQFLGAIEPFVRDYGPWALFVVLTLESLGLPVPGESALIAAGTFAERGEISLGTALIAAWAGAVLGDNIGYVIGRAAGRPLIVEYGSRIGITSERFTRVETLFDRYGPFAVAGARFVNVLRQLNGIVAGTMGMDWRIFVVCNALGGALWVLVWGLGAWWIGSHLEHAARLKDLAVQAESAVLPAIAIGLCAALAYWRWRQAARATGTKS